MASAATRHLLSPDPANLDPSGQRWCVRCRLPERNRVHDVPVSSDPAKDRILKDGH